MAAAADGRRCLNALVNFFNTPEGYSAFGWHGDEQGWTPEETAIHAMKELIELRAKAPTEHSMLIRLTPTASKC